MGIAHNPEPPQGHLIALHEGPGTVLTLTRTVGGECLCVQILQPGCRNGFLVPHRLGMLLNQPIDLVVLQLHITVAGP